MPDTVTVMCRIQNGLLLQMAAPWFNNTALNLIDAEPVLLRPGPNAIDAAYWQAWLGDHPDSPLIETRFLYEM